VTPGAFDTTFHREPCDGGTPCKEAFVTKFNAAGSALAYSTFIGGTHMDEAMSISVDFHGNAYVTGWTKSVDFPITSGAFDSSHNGQEDAFVLKMNQAGSALIYSTYLGGTDWDKGWSLEVDSSENAYVAGLTESHDFPTTLGAYDRYYNGAMDAFLAKVNVTGGSLVYSTYFGGGGNDWALSLKLDSSDNAYVVGATESTNLPTTSDAFDLSLGGESDAYMAKLSSAGTSLIYSTYLGGHGAEQGFAGTLDVFNNAYATGWTGSSDFPTTIGAFDETREGSIDVFVTKMQIGAANGRPVISSFTATESREGEAVIFEVRAADPDGDPLAYSFDFDSDGAFEVSSSNSTASHVWGDDYLGTAIVRVSDGLLYDEATTAVIVGNVPPSVRPDVRAYASGNLTLRVAGEKWHDVNLTVYRNGVAVANASVIRTPGSPDDQAATIENFTIDLLEGNLSAVVRYTPDDDPINGQPNGANPAWLIFAATDGSVSIHHTFNVRHNDTWIWRVDDLRALLTEMNFTFTATATDPGSDDLTFTWEWGDGSPATATICYNDGIGPDPYPSPGGTFPFTVTDVQMHSFAMAGTYTVTLRVLDDDGGTSEVTLVIDIG